MWSTYFLLVKQMLCIGRMTAISDFLGKQHCVSLEDIRKVPTSGKACGMCKSCAYDRRNNATEVEEVAKSL